MLTNVLNYFKRVTDNEALQLECFNEASQRYLKLTGSEEQRSLAAVRICVKIHHDLIEVVETPWSDGFLLKVSTLTVSE